MIDRDTLAELMLSSQYVLLDFDGPVCDVFSGLPARGIAEKMRQMVADAVSADQAQDVMQLQDPLEIIRHVAEVAPHLAPDADAALRQAELRAVQSAEPTPGATGFLMACHESGRPVAVVSNNSAPAIEAYLTKHGLSVYVRFVAGRDPDDPRRMKPDPFLLAQAVTALDADPETTVLVGDSITDIEAAHAFGISAIGYANKPGKDVSLGYADALTEDMRDLAKITYRPPFTPEPVAWTPPSQ